MAASPISHLSGKVSLEKYACIEKEEGRRAAMMFSGLVFILLKIVMCVCVYVCTCICTVGGGHAMENLWWSEDNFVELAPSFHLHMGSRSWIQVVRLLQRSSLPAEPSGWLLCFAFFPKSFFWLYNEVLIFNAYLLFVKWRYLLFFQFQIRGGRGDWKAATDNRQTQDHCWKMQNSEPKT